MAIIAFAALLSVARGFRYDEVGGETTVAPSKFDPRTVGVVYDDFVGDLSYGAGVGCLKMVELALQLLSILEVKGVNGPGDPQGYDSDVQEKLKNKIQDFITKEKKKTSVKKKTSFVYQAITLHGGIFASVAATPAMAEILNTLLSGSGTEERLAEEYPHLAGWKRSTNPETQQWAYILELENDRVPWENAKSVVFENVGVWDEQLAAVKQELQMQLAPTQSFFSEMVTYSSMSDSGGWVVNVHIPAYEIYIESTATAKKNELRTGTGLVADLIVAGPEGRMKVGWNEDNGVVLQGVPPGIRLIPQFLKGADDNTMKALYFSSMFKVGDAW